MFDRFTTKYGFRQEFGIHCHMLRQTFSNMQIEANRNIKKVQHLLGHKDAKTTQLHYNSVVDHELDEEGANLIDTLFNKETLQNKDLDNGETYIEKDMPAYHIDTNEQPKNLERVTNLEVNNTNSDDQELEELEELERLIEEKKRRLRLKKEKDFEM